ACSRRAPTGRRNRALIAVLHGGGLRISEALGTADKPGKPGKPGLRRGDVTRRDDMTGRIVIRDGKGSKSRSVTVDAATMAKLQDWMSCRDELGLGRRGWLFCTLAGGRMNERYVRNMLGRMAERAGIDKRVHP